MLPDSASPLVRVQNVSRTYSDGNVAALNDVSFAVHSGEYVAIMGPSGSGKSTLLQIIGALDKPCKGEVFFQGQPLSQNRDLDSFRALHVGFAFQSFHLMPMLTAAENVQIPMFETGLKARQRAAKALDLLDCVGMSHRAGQLSSLLSVGERQRVAIARALANDPPLILADEPTGSLDSRACDDVLALLDRLHAQTVRTMMIVTHSQEVANHATRCIRIRDGRVVADEPQAPFRSAGGT